MNEQQLQEKIDRLKEEYERGENKIQRLHGKLEVYQKAITQLGINIKNLETQIMIQQRTWMQCFKLMGKMLHEDLAGDIKQIGCTTIQSESPPKTNFKAVLAKIENNLPDLRSRCQTMEREWLEMEDKEHKIIENINSLMKTQKKTANTIDKITSILKGIQSSAVCSEDAEYSENISYKPF